MIPVTAGKNTANTGQKPKPPAVADTLDENPDGQRDGGNGQIPDQPVGGSINVPCVDETRQTRARLLHIGDEVVHRVDGAPNGQRQKDHAWDVHVGCLVSSLARVEATHLPTAHTCDVAERSLSGLVQLVSATRASNKPSGPLTTTSLRFPRIYSTSPD